MIIIQASYSRKAIEILFWDLLYYENNILKKIKTRKWMIWKWALVDVGERVAFFNPTICRIKDPICCMNSIDFMGEIVDSVTLTNWWTNYNVGLVQTVLNLTLQVRSCFLLFFFWQYKAWDEQCIIFSHFSYGKLFKHEVDVDIKQ